MVMKNPYRMTVVAALAAAALVLGGCSGSSNGAPKIGRASCRERV